MSEVQVSADFQTRLFEKIKTDIGSLMSDEELKKLVASAIERIWFTPVKEYRGYNNSSEKPPELLVVVREALATQVRRAVDDWVVANPEAVKKALDEALKGGLASALVGALDLKMKGDFDTLRYGLQNALQAIGAQR